MKIEMLSLNTDFYSLYLSSTKQYISQRFIYLDVRMPFSLCHCVLFWHGVNPSSGQDHLDSLDTERIRDPLRSILPSGVMRAYGIHMYLYISVYASIGEASSSCLHGGLLLPISIRSTKTKTVQEQTTQTTQLT